MESNNIKYMALDSLPVGYKFRPLGEELLVHYLKKKVLNEPLPPSRIMVIELYRYSPEQLEEMYKLPRGEKEMFFFTQRDRKHQNGNRPNRMTGNGYRKATGADNLVIFECKRVGFKKTLVFYRGTSRGHAKTNWIMHEFRVDNPPPSQKGANNAKLDWVLCRIYNRSTRSNHQLGEEGARIMNNHNDANEAMNNNAVQINADNNLEPKEMVNSTEYANPSGNTFAATSMQMMPEPLCVLPTLEQPSIQIPYSIANDTYSEYNMNHPVGNSFPEYPNANQNAYAENLESLVNYIDQPLNCGSEANLEMPKPKWIMPTEAHAFVDSLFSNADVNFDGIHQPMTNNIPQTLQSTNSMTTMDPEPQALNANHVTSAETVEPLTIMSSLVQSMINSHNSTHNLWVSTPTTFEDDIWSFTYNYGFSF